MTARSFSSRSGRKRGNQRSRPNESWSSPAARPHGQDHSTRRAMTGSTRAAAGASWRCDRPERSVRTAARHASRDSAGARGRTEMTLRSNDFESFASASSATPAKGAYRWLSVLPFLIPFRTDSTDSSRFHRIPQIGRKALQTQELEENGGTVPKAVRGLKIRWS
jgi:hypothetical protein